MIVVFFALFVLLAGVMFYAAIYVTPLIIGALIGYWAANHGAGPVGGVVVGFFSGIAVFGISQMILAFAKSPWLRGAVLLLCVLPPTIIGYGWVLEFSEYAGVTGAIWRHLFAIIGAAVFGGVAFVRYGGGGGLGAEPIARRVSVQPATHSKPMEAEIIDAEWSEAERPVPMPQRLVQSATALSGSATTSRIGSSQQ
jgi:hypothetical protein